jgi:hypothetical protein
MEDGMNTFVAELQKEVNKFRKAEKRKQDNFMKKQARQAKVKREDKSMLRKEEFYWSDAPKYAQQYYGETYHETTRHDNDWGDY